VSDAPTLPTPAAYVAAEPPAARAEREADGARTPDATLASPSLPDRPTTPASGANPAGEPSGSPWWTAFADPALDATIQEALRKNYFIRDLRNLIYENELDPLMPNSPLWPLKIGLPATLQHVTAALPPAPQVGKTPAAPAYGLSFAEADVGISASYQLDVFGQLDVQRRILEDQVQLQKMNTEAFAHTLADQVAQLWFDILEQRELQKLLEEQIRYSDELLSIVKARFEQHLAPRLAVLQQEQLLLNTQAQVPLVAAQLALLNSKLTLLLGRTPNPDMELVPYDRKLPDLPPAPAIGSPADLFRNSPDVRVAQARSAEGEHLLSQNLASWLPVVEVIGAAGAQTFDFNSKFFTSAL
jgi:outer membrane protein TolC